MQTTAAIWPVDECHVGMVAGQMSEEGRADGFSLQKSSTIPMHTTTLLSVSTTGVGDFNGLIV